MATLEEAIAAGHLDRLGLRVGRRDRLYDPFTPHRISYPGPTTTRRNCMIALLGSAVERYLSISCRWSANSNVVRRCMRAISGECSRPSTAYGMRIRPDCAFMAGVRPSMHLWL